MSSDSGSARAISLEPEERIYACADTQGVRRRHDSTLRNEGRGLSCMPRER
jgi:hypothetical protein